MKKYLSIIVGLMLVLGSPSVFAANDLTISTGTPISVGGYTLLIYGGDKVIDSLTVSDSSFSVTLSPSASFSVSSSDRKNFSVGGANGIIADVQCTDTLSSVTVSALSTNVSSDSITVTPLSTTCVPYSGGGGGGGQVYITPEVTTPVATTTIPVVVSQPQLPVQVSQIATIATTAVVVKHTFKTALKFGSTGAEVIELQKRLTEEGVYSGPITGYFGSLTLVAVKKYQERKGISIAGQPGYGNVGPLTRAALNSYALSAVTTATVSSITTAQALSIVGLLEAFGADASVIANVKASLGIK